MRSDNEQQTDRQSRGPFPSHAVWRPGVFFDVGFARENTVREKNSIEAALDME